MGIKKKQEKDGSVRYKSRIVSKGFMQVPGVDYTEKFSPVANDATTRIIIGLTLAYKDLGWKCESVDIEAAFLEGEIDTPSYMEWPPGSVDLGYVTQENRKKTCILLLKSIYGNVDAALRFNRLYATHLKSMGLIRSRTEACFFFQKSEIGKMKLMVSIHVDDTLVAGNPMDIKFFKEGLRTRLVIKELGELTQHLGIKYKWTQDEHGLKVVATMDTLINETITLTETHLG